MMGYVGWEIPEGKAIKVEDASGNVLWSASKFVEIGTITTDDFTTPYSGGVNIPEHLLGDFSSYNALLVNGKVYRVVYTYSATTDFERHMYRMAGDTTSDLSTDCPFRVVIMQYPSGKCSFILMSYLEGTYDVSIGTIK